MQDLVRALFLSPLLSASIRLFSAAMLMALAEWIGKKTRSLDDLTWLDSLIIGFFQVLAVFPGASRSGSLHERSRRKAAYFGHPGCRPGGRALVFLG